MPRAGTGMDMGRATADIATATIRMPMITTMLMMTTGTNTKVMTTIAGMTTTTAIRTKRAPHA